jgi:hypothetical protein
MEKPTVISSAAIEVGTVAHSSHAATAAKAIHTSPDFFLELMVWLLSRFISGD